LPAEVVHYIQSSQQNNREIFGKKGPVFATAVVAGVQGVKRTSDLIPLCHPIPIDGCDVTIEMKEANRVAVDCIVNTTGKTGVEMEALVGASTAALCVYDMLKALSKDITIENIRLIKKSGGKSDYHAT
jgi:cyclic pyranopterin monophosphate synthase